MRKAMSTITSKSKILTIGELATELGLSVRTIRHLQYKRAIPVIKIGSMIRFDEQRVRAAIAKFELQAV